jgi:hypothetical protein
LERVELDLGVQKTHATKVSGTPTHIDARLQGSPTCPNGLPGKGPNGLDLSAGRRGESTLIPKLAEDLAVDKKSPALKSTRPCAKFVGS